MKRWYLGLPFVFLAACSGSGNRGPLLSKTPDSAINRTYEVELSTYGPAPELTNEVWLNTDRPLKLADLRGQVVLIDFWTFG